MDAFYLVPAAGVVALIYAFWKSMWVNKQDPGNERMQEIGQAVREGAMAFLAREYKVLAITGLLGKTLPRVIAPSRSLS